MGQTYTMYAPQGEDGVTYRARLNDLFAEAGFGLRYTENKGALQEALRALLAGDAVVFIVPRPEMDAAIEGLSAIAAPWAQDLARTMKRAKERREAGAV